MGMHEHVTCKKKLHHGQNPIQTTTLTRYNQSHNPKIHEHVKKMLENVMHNHMISQRQNPTQEFQQNHKKPKKFPKPKTQDTKCMKDEEKKGLRQLTKGFELGRG